MFFLLSFVLGLCVLNCFFVSVLFGDVPCFYGFLVLIVVACCVLCVGFFLYVCSQMFVLVVVCSWFVYVGLFIC